MKLKPAREEGGFLFLDPRDAASQEAVETVI